MKKPTIKVLLTLLIMVGVFATSINTVNAASLTRTYSGQFVEDWSYSASSSGAELEYGFNTLFIKEDTCYANHNNSRHYARIKNGNGVHVGSSKAAGTWSRIEVTHSGSTVTYSCEW